MSPEVAERPAPTARPSGKMYTPRKPASVEFCFWNDDSTAVLVYGTHDVALARKLAATSWAAEIGGDLPEPVAIWVKKVPWDALGLGVDSTVLEVSGDTRGSTPVLRFGGDS